MKSTFFLLVLTACVALLASPAVSQNKYVGVKVCAPCHKMEKIGNQFGVWQKAKHAEAYKVLTTPVADSIAKTKGSKKSAAESPECLACHVLNAKLAEKTFDPKDGVQCEVCHGPGSAYKSMTVMKDTAKAFAAGLTVYKDNAAIAAKCQSCHNQKSPTFKSFDFKTMWAKIQHPIPKKT